jgi:hypothetical protein
LNNFSKVGEITTRYAVCGLCFHLVKNYGKLFSNLAPPPFVSMATEKQIAINIVNITSV